MRITCVGDCGVDRYVNLKLDRPGGIMLNFAVNARRLFPPSDRIGIITAVGTDRESQIVLQALERYGLESCLTRMEGKTSIQYIDLEPSGEKIFLRYEQGVLEEYRLGERERRIVAQSGLLMATVYAQIESFFDSVMAASSPGLRAVDFGDLADLTEGVGLVARYLDQFHLGFFGLRPEDLDLIDRLDDLARRGDKLFVVTLGAGGSLALGRKWRISCPAVPVPRVVDTTGAGDAFAAGFLSEYCCSRRVEESLRRGSEVAAEAVQRIGAF